MLKKLVICYFTSYIFPLSVLLGAFGTLICLGIPQYFEEGFSLEDEMEAQGIVLSASEESGTIEDTISLYKNEKIAQKLAQHRSPYGKPRNLLKHNNIVYFTSHEYGLGTLPIKENSKVEPIGYLGTNISSLGFKEIDLSDDGKYAVLSNRLFELWLVDVQNPVNPKLLSKANDIYNSLSSPIIVGELVLTAAKTKGIGVFDIRDKKNIKFVDFLASSGSVKKLVKYDKNKILIELNSTATLLFYWDSGIAQEHQMVYYGALSLSPFSSYVIAKTSKATYLIASKGLASVLDVYDISNPGRIEKVNSFDVSFNLKQVELFDNNRVYMSGKEPEQGIHSLALTTDGGLEEHHFHRTVGQVEALALTDSHAYVIGGKTWPGIHTIALYSSLQ